MVEATWNASAEMNASYQVGGGGQDIGDGMH